MQLNIVSLSSIPLKITNIVLGGPFRLQLRH